MATTSKTAAKSAATKTINFSRERETKNTVRFSEVVEDGDPTVIGTLYVAKFALKELGSPENLTVTLTAV